VISLYADGVNDLTGCHVGDRISIENKKGHITGMHGGVLYIQRDGEKGVSTYPMATDRSILMAHKFSLIYSPYNEALKSVKPVIGCLRVLLDSGAGSDLIIECRDKEEIKAHTFILTTASDFFQAQVNWPAGKGDEQKGPRTIQLTSFSRGVVMVALRLFYTGEFECPDDGLILDVIRFAYFVMADDLKDIAIEYACVRLTHANFPSYGLLAKDLECTRIADACMCLLYGRKFIAPSNEPLPDPMYQCDTATRSYLLNFLYQRSVEVNAFLDPAVVQKGDGFVPVTAPVLSISQAHVNVVDAQRGSLGIYTPPSASSSSSAVTVSRPRPLPPVPAVIRPMVPLSTPAPSMLQRAQMRTARMQTGVPPIPRNLDPMSFSLSDPSRVQPGEMRAFVKWLIGVPNAAIDDNHLDDFVRWHMRRYGSSKSYASNVMNRRCNDDLVPLKSKTKCFVSSSSPGLIVSERDLQKKYHVFCEDFGDEIGLSKMNVFCNQHSFPKIHLRDVSSSSAAPPESSSSSCSSSTPPVSTSSSSTVSVSVPVVSSSSVPAPTTLVSVPNQSLSAIINVDATLKRKAPEEGDDDYSSASESGRESPHESDDSSASDEPQRKPTPSQKPLKKRK
jgi:hypothetical protein